MERPTSMAFLRVPFSAVGAALLALACGACSRDARDQPSHGASNPVAASNPVVASNPAAASTPVSATATLPPSLRSGHYAFCDSLAALWQQMAGVAVTQRDTIISPQSAGPPTSACRVAMDAPNGIPEGSLGKVDWADSTFPGWRQITRWEAEGPDGFQRIFVRAGLRCQVNFTQDGGDDSDSTYVPSPSVAERTICWPDPAGVTARDTAWPPPP